MPRLPHALQTLAGTGLMALLAACAAPPPTPLASLEPPRLEGTWYQLAALPSRADAHCDSDTQWQLQADADGLAWDTRCLDRDGQVHQRSAHLRPDPVGQGARWQARGPRTWSVATWVLAMGPGDRWALVGDPGRREAWLVARRTWLPPTDWDAAWQAAEQQGFTRQDFRVSAQFGRTEGPPPAPRPR